MVETNRDWQLWQLYARSALSGAFSSFASVLCNTLANKQKTWRLGKGLGCMLSMAVVSCEPAAAGQVQSSRSGFHLTAPQLVPPLPAAHHRWVLLTGACDDEYSTCWLSVQQQTVVGSLPHDGG